MTRSPCLQEQWFVADTVAALAGLCPLCRANLEAELRLFGATNEEALSPIYRQSRAIRVQAVFTGRPLARQPNHWDALQVLRTIGGMCELSAAILFQQQPHLVNHPIAKVTGAAP